MSTPFVYGKIATLENFTDREKETELLVKNFSSSASVIRVRNALVEKEILDHHNGRYLFQDPMYRFWLMDSYFKTN